MAMKYLHLHLKIPSSRGKIRLFAIDSHGSINERITLVVVSISFDLCFDEKTFRGVFGTTRHPTPNPHQNQRSQPKKMVGAMLAITLFLGNFSSA